MYCGHRPVEPEVGCRYDKTLTKDQVSKNSRPVEIHALNIATNPMVIYSALAVCAVLGISAMVSAYVPLYNQYLVRALSLLFDHRDLALI